MLLELTKYRKRKEKRLNYTFVVFTSLKSINFKLKQKKKLKTSKIKNTQNSQDLFFC